MVVPALSLAPVLEVALASTGMIGCCPRPGERDDEDAGCSGLMMCGWLGVDVDVDVEVDGSAGEGTNTDGLAPVLLPASAKTRCEVPLAVTVLIFEDR